MADQADNLRQLVRAHREWRAVAPAASHSRAPDHGPGDEPQAACRPRGHAPPLAAGRVQRFLVRVLRRP